MKIVSHRSSVFRLTGTILAFSLVATLFWCGDGDCLTAPGDDQCSKLICSILGAAAGLPGDEHDASQECTCLCQAPTIPGTQTDIAFVPPVFTGIHEMATSIPSSPSRLIYHPPLSA